MVPVIKKLTRKSGTFVRDKGQLRELVLTIYPNGTLGLRPLKTRQEEVLTLESCYSLAVKQRVAKERAEKVAKRKVRR